ncbi:MAG: hypothetical protein BWK74_02200 [Desulfobacteraceae bacterium A6]|nr:MAG: hypothetical protein BWK74_02200 [Desulfobacteraceae bacterium A6]
MILQGFKRKEIMVLLPHKIETFEEYPILSKFKEGDNKDLGFWFIVAGFWLKREKPQTRDHKPETLH